MYVLSLQISTKSVCVKIGLVQRGAPCMQSLSYCQALLPASVAANTTRWLAFCIVLGTNGLISRFGTSRNQVVATRGSFADTDSGNASGVSCGGTGRRQIVIWNNSRTCTTLGVDASVKISSHEISGNPGIASLHKFRVRGDGDGYKGKKSVQEHFRKNSCRLSTQ